MLPSRGFYNDTIHQLPERADVVILTTAFRPGGGPCTFHGQNGHAGSGIPRGCRLGRRRSVFALLGNAALMRSLPG